MDRIWRAPAPPPEGGPWRLLQTRLLWLGLVLGIGFLLMVSPVISAALAALGKWWAPWFGDVAVVDHLFDLGVGFGQIASIFAIIYTSGSARR